MPTFATLWSNHPNVKGEAPLLDKRQYENQCAINVYAALQRSNVNVKTFPGQLSWQKDKPKYAIRAQEIASWLASAARPIPSTLEKFSGKEVFEKIKGKTGVIFLQNYWGQNTQGDHIDLFNGMRMTEISSWARIHLYVSWQGVWTNYRKAESVWFWKLP